MTAKKTYLLSSLSLVVTVLLVLASKYALRFAFGNAYADSDHFVWIKQIIIMYLIAIPAGIGVMCFIPRSAPEKHTLKFAEFIRFTLACYPLIVAGSLLGKILTVIFTLGKSLLDPMQELMLENGSPLMYLTTIILAPVCEELLFRKFLIDGTVRYGEKAAILFSAVTFGLFHANLSQIFYAAAAGLVFAYVYVRTGKIRYTIFMHMIINAMGSLSSFILSRAVNVKELISAILNGGRLELSSYAVPMLIAFSLSAVLNAVIAVGVVMLVKTLKRLKFEHAEYELQKGEIINTVYLNVGFIVFSAYCLIKTVINLMG